MMNADIDGSPAMEQDAAMAQCSGYGTESWVSINPYGHSPYDSGPMADYAGFGQFVPHELPGSMAGGSNRMPPPQPELHHHPHHHQLIQPAPPPMAHHQLPMLNTTWPSQLTNPTPATSSAASFSAPPLPITPVSSGPPATPAPPPAIVAPPAPAKGPRLTQAADGPKPPPEKVPRKTLSAEQKRAMCQYHDENPGTRQADIGAKFGVERSTVSKVLRHRDQYLKREQDPDFALKRGKGKHPDFDRTLSNYVRRQQQRGFDVKDDEILEQAKLFAQASGNQESLVGSLTSSWLHKFKQKHGIGAGRLMRRASETNIPDSARLSTAPARDGAAATGVSSVSPTQPLSPLSGTRSDEDGHRDTLDLDLTYRAHGSQSSTSLASDVRDNAVSSSFSADTLSPTAPSFGFSPDAFAVDQAPMHRREKRSNTFPSIDVNFVNREPPPVPEPTTPHPRPAPVATSAPSSAVQSPASDSIRAAPLTLNTALTSPPPPLRRTSSSNSSVTARSPAEASPVLAPTHEEARQAANILLSYIQRMSANGHFDQSEYLAVVQLTKKLQIHHHTHHHYHHHQAARPSLGGLSRIPEGDHEMPPPPPETMAEVR